MQALAVGAVDTEAATSAEHAPCLRECLRLVFNPVERCSDTRCRTSRQGSARDSSARPTLAVKRGFLRAATLMRSGNGSIPTTSPSGATRRATWSPRRPVPHPMSSTRSPGRGARAAISSLPCSNCWVPTRSGVREFFGIEPEAHWLGRTRWYRCCRRCHVIATPFVERPGVDAGDASRQPRCGSSWRASTVSTIVDIIRPKRNTHCARDNCLLYGTPGPLTIAAEA